MSASEHGHAPRSSTPSGVPWWRLSLVVALALVLFLAPLDFIPETTLWKRLGDAMHVPLLALIATGLWMVARRSHTFERSLISSHLAAALCAAAIEVLQPFTGRTASPADLLNGLAGIALSAAALSVREEQRRGRPRKGAWAVLTFVAAATMVLALIPAYRAFKLLQQRDRLLPTIAGFEERFEHTFWEPTTEHGASLALSVSPFGTGQALLVSTVPGQYSGVEYDAQALDISNYSRLALSVYLYGTESIPLQIRIDDDGECKEFQDRFNRSIQLQPGANRVEIAIEEIARGPRDRPLNLRAIQKVIIFTPPEPRSVVFALDRIQLE